MRYLLPNYVHFCMTDSGIVFLNLRKDKYIGLPADTCDSFDAIADGTKPLSATAATLACELCDRDLLTTDPLAGRVPQPASVPRVRLSLADDDCDADVSLIDACTLLRAWITAKTILRLGSLEWVVRRVKTRRDRGLLCGTRVPFDAERARELLKVFRRLRPLIYSATDQCILDSLTLLELFAANDFFPAWIFGVMTRPFLAHCWVQHEDVVLLDTVTRARMFTPIMTT
jgi:hypothetical protein